MFIYESSRLKKQINNTNKKRFILFKLNLLFFIYFILINKGKVSGQRALGRKSSGSILESKNKIFIIINKTINTEIINNTYYDKIKNIIINNNNPINITNYDNSIEKSKLEINYINITINWSPDLTSYAYMFYNLSNIIYIDLSDFDFYGVTRMEYMFSGCKSLLSIDFGLFETSSIGDIGVDMNNMFSGCNSLLSLNMEFFYGSKVNYDNEIINKNVFINNINDMFYECSSLVSLDLRNFDTSKVTEMKNLFFNCISLKYLNIISFDTSNTINMNNIFYGCISLISLNLYNFNISSLTSYDDIFKNINQNLIICIDNNNKNNAFFGQLDSFINDCNYICLKDNKRYFKGRNSCVRNCSNLLIGNPGGRDLDFPPTYKYYEYNNTCVEKCPNDTFLLEDKICKNYYIYNNNENFTDLPEGYYIIDNNLNYIDKCDIKCKYCTKESMQNNSCISCNTNNYYFPKYDNTNNEFINCYNSNTVEEGYFLDDNIYMPCYPTCKKCTKMGNLTNQECTSCYSNYILNKTNCDKICKYYYYFNSLNERKCTSEDKCPEEYSKLIIKEGRCIDDCKNDNIYKFEYENNCYESYPQDLLPSINTSCTVLHFFKRLCKINNMDINKIQSFILNILDSIKNGELNDLLSNVIGEYKEDIIISDRNVTYELTSSFNQNNKEYENISNIELGECENILKEKYNIDKNETLIIFKVDYILEGLNIPLIKYSIFNPKTKVELEEKHCKNTKIIMNIPVSIDEKDLDKYDPSSNYYNDKCFPYFNEKGVDMTLYDRKIEYNKNNMSLCQIGCEFQEYNSKTKKVNCKCDIQSKITVSLFLNSIILKEELIHKFIDIKKTANLGVIKCYKLFFTKEGLISNIGSYILLSILFFFFILSNLFYNKGFNEIKNKIYEIIKIKKENELNNNIKKKEGNNIIKNNNIIETEIIDKKFNLNLNMNYSDKKKKNIKFKRPSLPNFSIINSKEGIMPVINKKELKLEANSDNSNEIIINNNDDIIINNNIKFIDYELNDMSYEDALKNDKRIYFNYYFSLLKIKHLLLFSFFTYNDYNSSIIKIILFLFSFTLYYTINALFFNDSTMHKIYKDDGIYNFAYQINIIIYSSIISLIITAIIKFLSLSEKNILKIKNEKNIKNLDNIAKNELNCLKKKFILFFIICFLFLSLFWYYLGCFGAVYKNTQIHLIKDTLISFGLTLIYPLFLNLLPGIVRIPSLKSKGRKCMYKLSKIIQLI